MSSPVVVSYGGGVNSTAMLVGMFEHNERPPDLILFADTGGERPETYNYQCVMNAWLREHGYPEITVVRYVPAERPDRTLEEECVRLNMLPSLAYGFKKCSLKWKKGPQDKFLNSWEPAKLAWESGAQITHLMGYDAEEDWRATIEEDKKNRYRYPLIEWVWGRDGCLAAIERAGLPRPSKSACFFCPSSKFPEILALKAKHPDLYDRAVKMEQRAKSGLRSVKGLGRRFSWEERVNEFERASLFEQQEILNTMPIIPDVSCACYDG